MNGADPAGPAWLELPSGQRTSIRGSCFLGRSASCGLVLPDAKVSRQHALVQSQNENEFWLIDLGSANGTYLNGQRVVQPCRLAEGDAISIAGFTLAFHRPKAPGSSHAETSSEATIQEIRTQFCWLLVADIMDSTTLLRRAPAEEAPRITGRWLAECRLLIDAHQGAINKYLGDGFLAYWRAAATSVQSVAEVLVRLKALQDQATPPFRMVLHYGQVALGGVASLGEEGLSGSEVSFAFRMEKLAGSIGSSRLLSEPAQIKLAGLLAPVLEGRHTLPGFEGEFPFYSF